MHRSFRLRVWLLALGAVLALGPSDRSAAQEATPGEPAGAEIDAGQDVLEIPPEGIEAITVIGEQLDVTDVQDEAQAITRFSMDDLDKLNINNVDGLAANVPGLHVGQQGQAAIITLRGVGTENASITGESGVAFHVDGISYGRPTAARVAFFDVKMIDVRRGPQGLLGGKNSTSGWINVVTNDPSDEYEVVGDLLFGNYDRVRARGHINVPLGEFAAVRAAFFHEDRDGYLDNKLLSDSRDPFDADNFGFRTKLRLRPSDSLDLVIGYNYFKQTGNGPQADNVPIFTENICAGRPGLPRTDSFLPGRLVCSTNPASPDESEREIYVDDPSEQDDRFWGLHGTLKWDVPELPGLGLTQLELRGGYQRTDTDFNWDFDASDFGGQPFPLETRGLTHEYVTDARWMGTTLGERLEWQASLFFARESSESRTRNEVVTTSSTPGGPVTPRTNTLTTNQEVENKSYGAALHGSYRITDALTFSLGGRWIKDRKHSWLQRFEGRSEQEACVGGNFDLNRDGFPPVPECRLTDRGTMWGSRLEWRPLDDHLLYAGIDRGYKSGGFGLGGVGGYLPEKIWAYTLGTKSEFFDRRLQVNIEGFFYAYDDLQIALIDGTSTRTENSDARMYGWEVETVAAPIPGLQLRALISYLNTETLDYYSLDPAKPPNVALADRLGQRADAERMGEAFETWDRCFDLTTRTNVQCGQLGDRGGLDDYSGNQLSRSPEWKMTFSAEYEITLGELGSVQYTWQDDTYYRVFNRDFDLQEDYHKTDAKLIWDSPERRWTAEVFVENIEDEATKDYILIGSRVFNSPPLAWYGAPRFYGFRVGFRY
jgi:iron complex outermembrane receptor protein